MFANYLTVAIRNLLRNKGYSAISIFGLSVGMACCILVALFAQDELQYDAFHKDGDRIYRVVSEIRSQNGDRNVSIGVSGRLGPAVGDAFPEVETFARLYMNMGGIWFRNENQMSMENFCLADPNVFEFFSFPLVSGDAKTAIQAPFTAVVSESMARKYFKGGDPIGQTITVDERSHRGDYRITGVMKDLPVQSTLKMDFVTSTVLPGEADRIWNTWYELAAWRSIQTFVKVNAGASVARLESKLPAMVYERNDSEVELREAKPLLRYYLQPLTRMRLYSGVDYGILPPPSAMPHTRRLYGDIQRVYLLGAIAFFVLAIACINFMNLATARSARRAREVGLRKVVGAYRKGLIQQFLSESVLVALLALVFSVVIVVLVLPAFNNFLGKSLSLIAHGQVWWFLGLLGFAVVVGVVAGSYPAFYLSSFEPVDVLKGALQSRGWGAFVRKSLVVLQFSISILLIVGTVVVYRQLGFIQNKDLGFDKAHVVIMPIFLRQRATVNKNIDRLMMRYRTVKQAFLEHPNVLDATVCRQILGQRPGLPRVIRPEGFERADRFFLQQVDEGFIDFFDLELVAGRNFTPEDMFRYDKFYILNETAVKAWGWTEPLGKKVHRGNRSGTVIGVVKDFHNGSLHNPIEPAAFIPMSSLGAWLMLRVQMDQFSETVAFFDKTWKQFLPSRPLEFRFLDEQLNQSYDAEQRIAKSTGVFALIAIGLACLGLFALAAFTAEQRTKEIGVRKVLGASVGQIVMLLSKEFAVLVLIANVIAWPIAYFALNGWLAGFAYRTDLGIDVFLLGGGLALLIAFLTVSTQAVRASLTDPVVALRHE